MDSFLLWHNALDGATILNESASYAGFDGANLNDYRLDTSYKPSGAGTSYVTFDCLQTISTGLLASGTTTHNDRIKINLSDLREIGFYDNDYWQYTIAIDSGTGSGQSKTIISETLNDNVDNQKDFTLQVVSDWTTNPDATSVYTLTRIPFVDTCFYAGQLLSGTAAAANVFYSDNNSTYTSAFWVKPENLDRIFVWTESIAGAHRYWRVAIASGNGTTNSVAVAMIGKRTTMAGLYDEMALRAPFTKVGMLDSTKARHNQSNAGGFFPTSVRPEMRKLSLSFKHVSQTFLKSLIGAGLIDHIASKPFFVASAYQTSQANAEPRGNYDGVYCMIDGQIADPSLPDNNGRFNWKLKAKAFTGV